MQADEVKKMRAMAKVILEHSLSFDWSLQGLGMLRLHLSDDCRLHVWDTRFAFPNASPIHDHQQWWLNSTVLSGQLQNWKYCESTAPSAGRFMFQTLKAGYGCKALHEPREVWLNLYSRSTYFPGDSYAQEPAEIHRSVPENGTVTIMSKMPTADAENARVFWPWGEEWGSAEPRKATQDEILGMTSKALELWR